MARTYNQDCILAHAFDLLGERWTFLIIRDLFLGPQRFGDLQAGLPGLGANLLSKRLKELEEANLVAGPGPDNNRGRYRLTPSGEALRPTIRTLMDWSIHYFMERPESMPAKECLYSDNLTPDSVALAIELFAVYFPESDLSYVAHLTIDDFKYTLFYMNGEMTCRRGADAPAAATLSSDVATILQCFRKEHTMEEAMSRITTSGDPKVLDHLRRCIIHILEDEEADTPKQSIAQAE